MKTSLERRFSNLFSIHLTGSRWVVFNIRSKKCCCIVVDDDDKLRSNASKFLIYIQSMALVLVLTRDWDFPVKFEFNLRAFKSRYSSGDFFHQGCWRFIWWISIYFQNVSFLWCWCHQISSRNQFKIDFFVSWQRYSCRKSSFFLFIMFLSRIFLSTQLRILKTQFEGFHFFVTHSSKVNIIHFLTHLFVNI